MKTRRIGKGVGAALLGLWLAMGSPALAGEGAIDLRSATEVELVELPGIGPAKARAIVEYRREHGFESIDELRNVDGIGPATFDEIRDRVTLGH